MRNINNMIYTIYYKFVFGNAPLEFKIITYTPDTLKE